MAVAPYDPIMDRDQMKEELRDRARAMWPKHIAIESSKLRGDTMTITSEKMLTNYPAQLVLRIVHGQRVVEMIQILPKCGSRTWDIDEGDVQRSLKNQWSGILANIPGID